MSTKVEDIRYSPFPKVTEYFQIFWDPTLNVRKDYGTPEELRKTRDTLSTPLGWDAQYPPIAEVATPAEQERAVEILKARHAQLKNALQSEKLEDQPIQKDGRVLRVKGREYAEARLAAFEYIHCNKNGSYKKPIVIGTTGNRRGSQLVDAAACRLLVIRREKGNEKLQPADVSDDMRTHISVLAPATPDYRFPDVAVRMQAQLRENLTKEEGFKTMTEAENLLAVLDLVQAWGKSQTDVRNSGYGSTYGLRLYFACIIDVYCRTQAANRSLSSEERDLWKSVRLVERLTTSQYVVDDKGMVVEDSNGVKKLNPDWLDFRAFNQKAFQGDEKANVPPMGRMTEIQSKFDRDNGTLVNSKKPPLERPTAQQMIDWVEQLSASGGVKTIPMLKRTEITQLSSTHPNLMVREALLAVDNNKIAHLHGVVKSRSDVCNFVYGCADSVHIQLGVICSMLNDMEDEQQVELLQSFIDSLSTDAGEEAAE